LHEYQATFVKWTSAIGLAEQTALIRNSALNYFIQWCDAQAIREPKQITREILEGYQQYLSCRRKANGDPLALSTQVARLDPLKAFCKWLARERHVPFNPASELIVPSIPRRLPRRVLAVQEVRRILRGPDLTTPSGIRDRAIIELLYSSGVRRMELARLKVDDVDLAQGTLMVVAGKGNRDRLIPCGNRAAAWLSRYLSEVRFRLAGEAEDTLFLTDFGEPFRKNRLGDLVKRYVSNAGIPPPGACHLFRHACATHMLDNGADIRYIQAQLGHADLSTTQIYAHVSIKKLKEVHAATHPSP
jgi:integrase/recombinase XerD